MSVYVANKTRLDKKVYFRIAKVVPAGPSRSVGLYAAESRGYSCHVIVELKFVVGLSCLSFLGLKRLISMMVRR